MKRLVLLAFLLGLPAAALADFTLSGPITFKTPDFSRTGSTVSAGPSTSVCLEASCSGETTTGTVAAGQTALALNSPSDFGQAPGCLSGGPNCGVTVVGAGAAHTLTAPTAVTAASVCTPVPATASKTNGSSVLRLDTVAGVSVADTIETANVAPGTTVLDVNVLFPTVKMSAAAIANASADAVTFRDPCNKPYAFKIAAYTVNGGVGPASAAASTPGPQHLNSWKVVCLTWGAVPGAAGYGIWVSTDSGATYRWFGRAQIPGNGDCATASAPGPYLLQGQPADIPPFWMPAQPPVSAQSDWLRTYVMSGAGSSSLVLNAPAGTTVINMPVLHDDTTPFLAWLGRLNAGAGVGALTGTIRVAQSADLTLPASVGGVGRAVVKPFGGGLAGGALFRFAAGAVAPGAYTAAADINEGSNCVPLTSTAGLNPGDYLKISQDAPGGPTQSVPYVHISPIVALSCDAAATGVQVTDGVGTTFWKGRQTATLSGSLATGDTVSLTFTGDASCVATYTVVSGDTLSTLARGLALKILDTCQVSAGSTLNVVLINIPSAMTVSLTPATTHPSGGTEAIAMGTAPAPQINKITMLEGAEIGNLSIDMADAVANGNSEISGIKLNGVANSRFSNLVVSNVNGGGGIYSEDEYANSYDTLTLDRAASGVGNATGSSDIWLHNGTRVSVNNLTSRNSLSFGPQFDSHNALSVSNLYQQGAYIGRGCKFGAMTHAKISGLECSNNAFNGISIFSGSQRNLFENVAAHGNLGINFTGLTFFDAYNVLNRFTNVRLSSNGRDYLAGASDRGNVLSNVEVVRGLDQATGTFRSVVDVGGTSFYAISGCDIAGFNKTVQSNPVCVKATATAIGPGVAPGSQIAKEGLLFGGAGLGSPPGVLSASCAGTVSGMFWNDAGTVKVCP